ncbi:proline-rich protein PRCC [Helicoverpa armigera]|uniref:proline-rich protein PRCC n=1 Tax=Helicoverpa armigera TaxID=29058 RepID=UPI0030826E93
MALVAYGNSDSSDYEDEGDCEDAPVVLLNNKPESKHVPGPVLTKPAPINEEKVEDSQEDGPSLFNFLPQPSKKKPAVIEEDDEFLHKKEVANAPKPKARITVPSLNDFKDVKNSTPMVKPKPSDKKSGLLSMLPQPRNGVKATTKSLIPHVLTKQPAPVKKEPLPTPIKKAKVEATSLINEYSDDSDNDDVQNDFFSIHKPVELPEVELPLDITPKTEPVDKREGIDKFFKKEEDLEHVKLEPDYDEQSMDGQAAAGSSYDGYAAESSNNDVELDEEAIMKLCGARGKRKREDIQIVDVNQAEVLANAREMLMKGLMDDTTKRVSASKKKGNEPTTQQRRKHQITYLAYQAKANEAELQNQWANNRMSKRQTQAKYGF